MSPSPATPLMDEQVHGDQNRRWTLNSENHAIFDGCLFLDARRGSGYAANRRDGGGSCLKGTHNARQGQTTSSGVRPGLPLEPAPQRRAPVVGHRAALAPHLDDLPTTWTALCQGRCLHIIDAQ